MNGLICALTLAVTAPPNAWPQGAEWYLVGETRKLSLVTELDRDAKKVLVPGDDGKPVVLNFEPGRYVLLDGEPDKPKALVCGRQDAAGVSLEATTVKSAHRWCLEFGETVYQVRASKAGFDGKPVKVGMDTFVLVWKWDREVRMRSAGWVRQDAICPAPTPGVGRKFEDETAPSQGSVVLFPVGLQPTMSLEKYSDNNKSMVRVPTKVVIKRTGQPGATENFRVPCFPAPEGEQFPDSLKVLQHYYVFAASGGGRWYLVGAGDHVEVRGPDAVNRSLLGWVRAENVLLWGTGQSIEFDPVTRPRRVFPTPDGKRLLGLGEIHRTFDDLRDRYAGRRNDRRPAAIEIPEEFNNALSRMPILEQRILKVPVGSGEQSYTAYKVAYVGHNLVLPPKDRKYIQDLQARLEQVSTLDLLLVVDATANSGVHREALQKAVREAWDRVAERNREAASKASQSSVPFHLRIRVGVLAYRTPADRTLELEAFDFTEDPSTFDGWWGTDSKVTQRLQFNGGVNDDPHVSSVFKALGVALQTSATIGGQVEVEVPGRVDPEDPQPMAKRPVKLGWASGSQRVILAIGDVGQKEGKEFNGGWSRDRLAEEWVKLQYLPYLVGIQVGTPDWFTYPKAEIERAAVRGYERFRTDMLALAQQLNSAGPVADFYHLTQPGDRARRKEMAELFDKVWAKSVLERAQGIHQEAAGALKQKLEDLARLHGVTLLDLGDAARQTDVPRIVYDEGWVLERVPFADAPGFNEKQVRACVLIDASELLLIRTSLQNFSDWIKQARVAAAQESGANALARTLARSLAEIDRPVRDQILEVTARHPALHVLHGIMRWTPEEFSKLEESEIYRYEAAINQSERTIQGHLDAREDRGKWAEVGNKLMTWLPLSAFPDEQGQFPLTRPQVLQLRDRVLVPLHKAMLEARATEEMSSTKVAAGKWLARWASDKEGQTAAAVLLAPEFTQARVGVLGMSPAQFAALRPADVVRWHQSVYRAIKDCEAILNDSKAWVEYKNAGTTWYPVARLPNPDNVTPPDERDLSTEFQKYVRSRRER